VTQERFTGSFTQQEPIPEAGIEAALAVLRHGRLHRYNTAPGEVAETALLEEEFAALTGAKYCLAVASGGYALGCALRAVGVKAGDPVLTNAFTLAPVPGAIASVGAQPIFVDVTEDLVLDFADLAAKAKATGARVLMLSHMRGHLCDMEALVALCDDLGVQIIEDCAHTMGAAWKLSLIHI
jgi:dTDP-4-amino-4,6-dideoxygalactose transaminase